MDAESPMPGPFATIGDGDHEILCDLVTGRTLPVFALLVLGGGNRVFGLFFKIDLDGCRAVLDVKW